MNRPAVPLLIALALIASCVPTTLDPGANHPALPGARAGGGPEPATILRPESALTGPGIALRGQTAESRTPDGTRGNPYIGRGVVRGQRDGALVIDHEAIPGFMGAMTMAYPVAEGVDVAEFETGDQVTFRVEVPEPGIYRIFDVERIDPVNDAPR